MQAELTQTPFDMPVAESELVAGYMTEYTGLPLPAVLHRRVRLGRRVRRPRRHAVPRRLGAPGRRRRQQLDERHRPDRDVREDVLIGGLIFFVRFTYPRFREDQLQRFAWTCLIPIALVNILVTAVLKVAF